MLHLIDMNQNEIALTILIEKTLSGLQRNSQDASDEQEIRKYIQFT